MRAFTTGDHILLNREHALTKKLMGPFGLGLLNLAQKTAENEREEGGWEHLSHTACGLRFAVLYKETSHGHPG